MDNKRKNGHFLPVKSNKFSKTLEFDDEKYNSTDLLPTDGSRALSASRILRDLKQPVAPPFEAGACAIMTPFFKLPRQLNDNLCLFFFAYNVLDETKRLAFCKGNIDYLEEAFFEWVEEASSHNRGRLSSQRLHS